MYFHASSIQGIEVLEPRVSNHEVPLIYFSTKRENVLIYLSNAVEKYCRETGFHHAGKWCKWGPYGFTRDGRQRIEEYYPNALIETYRGVSGYIYGTDTIVDSGYPLAIPDAATSNVPTPVKFCEFVPDAYEAILSAEREGLLSILRYEESSKSQLEWMEKTIRQEYENAVDQPDYRHFLEGKFPFVR